MPDAFKVVALRADNGGCAYYRIKEPARAITERYPGIDITVDTGIDVSASKNRRTGMTQVDEIKSDADLIVIQRPLSQAFTSLIEKAHEQGIATVVELDDDFEHVHQRNIVWQNVQPSFHPESNYAWVQRACELADHVTVSTEALRRYAPHGRVSVVPNYISRHAVATSVLAARGSQPVRVGWSGSLQTHPTDLQVTKPAVNQVLRDTKSELVVVGDGIGVRDALGVAKSIRMSATGWKPVDQYMSLLARSMDVGVVPLDRTPFNEAKSHLKGLEYAACGIPFVASPLPEYQALTANGIGQLAETPSEWRRELDRFIRSEPLRIATGEAYQSIVREKYILENHVEEWVSAWRAAISFRKGCTT